MGFFYPTVVEILNFDTLGPLRTCGDMTHVSHAYTLGRTSRTFIWGSYRPQQGGGVNSLVANYESDFKILTSRKV